MTVNQMSIDHVGEFVASCSLDGKILIKNLVTGENDLNTDLHKAIYSVSIDPIYARTGSGKRFMTGNLKCKSFPASLT